MNYRVIKITHKDDSISYMPQYTFFFGLFSFDMYPGHLRLSLQQALDSIDDELRRAIAKREVIK
jgi:hypothetical protein